MWRMKNVIDIKYKQYVKSNGKVVEVQGAYKNLAR